MDLSKKDLKKAGSLFKAAVRNDDFIFPNVEEKYISTYCIVCTNVFFNK